MRDGEICARSVYIEMLATLREEIKRIRVRESKRARVSEWGRDRERKRGNTKLRIEISCTHFGSGHCNRRSLLYYSLLLVSSMLTPAPFYLYCFGCYLLLPQGPKIISSLFSLLHSWDESWRAEKEYAGSKTWLMITGGSQGVTGCALNKVAQA